MLRVLFLLLISLFLFMKTICLVIPFPFGKLSYLLICDEIPRYFVFVGWELLSLWLGTALLSNTFQKTSLRAWISVIFITLFVLSFAASVILCVLTVVCFILLFFLKK